MRRGLDGIRDKGHRQTSRGETDNLLSLSRSQSGGAPARLESDEGGMLHSDWSVEDGHSKPDLGPGHRRCRWRYRYGFCWLDMFFSGNNGARLLFPSSNDSSLQAELIDTHNDHNIKIIGSGLGPWRPWTSIIKSNFENQNFSILISDLDCLQKCIIAKCSSFFHILIRT